MWDGERSKGIVQGRGSINSTSRVEPGSGVNLSLRRVSGLLLSGMKGHVMNENSSSLYKGDNSIDT